MNKIKAEAKAKDFVENLKTSFIELKKVYESINIDITEHIPNVFKDFSKTEIRVLYSVKSKQYFVLFDSDKQGEFKFNYDRVTVNPIPMIRIDGKYSEMTLINSTFSYGKGFKFTLEYAFLYTEASLDLRIKNTIGLANDIIRSSMGYSHYLNRAPNKESDKGSYIKNLRELAEVFLGLINDESITELIIDKFLEEHPIILKEGLRIDHLIHQATLKNTLSIYPHNLKPDLIAYDVVEKTWIIIDYKRANRNLRSGLKAEVHSLKDQLFDYKEYFDEEIHRKAFQDEYGVTIKNPNAVGIVGILEEALQGSFNRVLQNEPRWFKVTPYNYLYDNFVRHIESGENFIEGL